MEPKLHKFRARAVIFDKDGTLIDFNSMWGGWAVYLAGQLKQVCGLEVEEDLCLAMGYDIQNKKVLAGGKLAMTPMPQLRKLTVEVLRSLGLGEDQAEEVVRQAWCIPDPVMLAKPLTDLRGLFHNLQSLGIKVGIATADDRAPTQAMIEAFDLEDYINAVVCGDDGVPSKPMPDMVLALCERMRVEPEEVMVVGDTLSDLKMARAAGAGLAVGVLCGVSDARDLIHHADVLIESIEEINLYAQALQGWESSRVNGGLAADFALGDS